MKGRRGPWQHSDRGPTFQLLSVVTTRGLHSNCNCVHLTHNSANTRHQHQLLCNARSWAHCVWHSTQSSFYLGQLLITWARCTSQRRQTHRESHRASSESNSSLCNSSHHTSHLHPHLRLIVLLDLAARLARSFNHITRSSTPTATLCQLIHSKRRHIEPSSGAVLLNLVRLVVAALINLTCCFVLS